MTGARVHAQHMALLGLAAPPPRGMRLLFTPTFHEAACIVLDASEGALALHRLPQAVAMRTFWAGGRLLDPDPAMLAAQPHPSDVVEVDAAHQAQVMAAAEALAVQTAASAWIVPDPSTWRDGMCVYCELAGPDWPAQVLGVGVPVGMGPPGHAALAAVVLEVALAAAPQEQPFLAPLLGYGLSARAPERGRITRGR